MWNSWSTNRRVREGQRIFKLDNCQHRRDALRIFKGLIIRLIDDYSTKIAFLNKNSYQNFANFDGLLAR